MQKRWTPAAVFALALIAGSSLADAATSVRPPSLATQLAVDRVQPGSALERLILDNQDFQMLDRSELSDQRLIPLWLRVVWRKAHPEGDYDMKNPTGGYPHVLREAHEWMLAHQDLLPGEIEGDVPPELKVLVGGNLRISGAQTTPRSESDIRINYWNGQKIISGSNNISASGAQAMFYSTDGGVNWGQTNLPIQTGLGDAFHSDPTVDWTSNSDAWSTTIGINSAATVLKMRLYKSTTSGATWSFDSTFSGTQTQADKQMVWVDHSATSAYADQIYATWHNGNPAFFNRRVAGVWGAPVQLSGGESTGTCIGGDVKSNANGDVFVFWPTTTNGKIFVRKSTDGGGTFSAAVQVVQLKDRYDIGVPSFNNRRALIYVSGGAYRTSSKNMAYAAWTDLSGEAGCTSGANEPGANVASTCKTRVWVSRSSDGGATWSAALMINNQASLNDQFNQWLVVDESTGAVGVIYYDTVADAGRKKTDVWYQASYDDGAAWTVPVKITTAQTDETAASANAGNQYGDYNGLSGYARVLFPSWTDRRNNAKEEIWTVKLEEPRVDVWSKDKPWDTGLEPDPATAANNMWESEDIWVCPDANPCTHTDPEFGQTNYIHVMIRNLSSTLTAENIPVYVYVANASAGLSWQVDWTLVGTATVASLGPLASTDVSIPWNPAGTGHYCLLSRLVTAQDPMTNAETTDVNYNTRYNNNIVWKNVNVVNLMAIHAIKATMIVRNPDRIARTIKLVFLDRDDTETRRPFLGRGRVEVNLGKELATRWKESGNTGEGIRALDDTRIEITESDGYIQIKTSAREAFNITLVFEDTAVDTGNKERAERHRIEVREEDAESGVVIGGVTYEITAPETK